MASTYKYIRGTHGMCISVVIRQYMVCCYSSVHGARHVARLTFITSIIQNDASSILSFKHERRISMDVPKQGTDISLTVKHDTKHQ